ncbi:MAG: hypothetical protein U5R30_02405 [Deltaproteobacteria bacterium]|nr:hypothetical protein [Deltaproteobacteria bacterium]
MDRQFLEFWGNYLLSAARGQKHLEDVTSWIRGGLRGVDELTALFKKYYGLEEPAQDRPESRAAWEKAAADFKQSFQDYFRIMGWVSKDEYQNLLEENQALKQKIAAQDQAIARLRDLLKNPGIDLGSTLNVLQDLTDKQSTEFQKLVKKFSEPDD